MIAQGILRLGLSIAVCLWIGVVSAQADRSFAFSRDTFSFDNETALEFHDGQASLEDKELADRIRRITRVPPWDAPFATGDRIIMPGYKDLRSLSEARPEILQKNIGLGWPTYFRPG